MATPIVVVASKGLPVTLTSNGSGSPMTISTNGYGIPVTVVASGGMPVTGFTTGPDITAPIITSSNTISQPENTALVHFLTANEPVTWAKVGGADTAKFTLGSGATAGQLSLPAKDYEAPDDADANRTYIVQVQATDAAANPSTIQTITVTITDVVEIAAPVLTWTSGTTDTTPNFSVDLPSGFGDFRDAVTGDVIYLEIADNISFTTTSTETLDAGEVGGDIVLMEQTTPLADGTYYAKARLKRGATFGTYSNIETKTITTSAPYQGPGDVVAGALGFYSAARAYTTAFAATAAPIMDIAESNGTTSLTTINIKTTGFVDLVALNAWIAAHGTAYVVKLYDQTGNGRHITNATVGQLPTINVSALNSLPGLVFVVASAHRLTSTATLTQATPLSFSAVAMKTTTASSGVIGSNTNPAGLVGGAAADGWSISSNTSLQITGLANNVYHAVQAVAGSSGSITGDGAAAVTGTSGTTGYSSSLISMGRANAATWPGTIMEVMLWAGDKSASFGALNANQHGTNGYNF